MKRVFITLALLVVLVACGTESTYAGKEERFTGYGRGLHIVTDKETGCKYIILASQGGYGGITPLALPDGTQDCGGL